jgi:zinc protease
MLKRRILMALVVVVVCCLPAAAELDSNRSLTWDPAVYRETLPNGLQVFLRENHRPEKRIELRLVVKAGSIYEEEGEFGIAHFLEHMAFNGTTHFAPGELVKYMESVGAEFGPDTNAYTAHDRTTYMLTLPCDDLEVVKKGLVVMADYMAGILFLPEEIDKERGVILEEFRMYEGIYMRMAQKAVKIAAPGSRWDSPRLMVVGDKDDIKSITQEDFRRFYKKWYRPDRMALIVVGDLPVETMRGLVKEIVEPVPRAEGEPEFPEFPMPDHKEIRTGIISDRELPSGGGAFVFVRPNEPVRTEGDFRRSLIDSMSYSLLNERLRELKELPEPPFLEASIMNFVSVPWFELRGGFAITLQMKQEKKALQAVVREAERARRYGFTEGEIRAELLDREESNRRAAKEKDKNFSEEYAYGYLNAFMSESTALSEDERYRLAKDVSPTITADEVKARTAELLAPVNMSIGLALPEWQKKAYKKDDILAWYDAVVAEDIPPYTGAELKKGSDYSKLQPAEIVERAELEAVGATRVKFKNGLTLYVKKTDFQEDEIRIASYNPYFAAWEESWRNYGVTDMMERLWGSGGTGEFKDSQLEKLHKGKGFSIWPGMNFGGWSINRDLEDAFQWMYDYMTQPGFREEALTIIKNNERLNIKNGKLDQDTTFGRAVDETLCPGGRRAVFIDDDNYYDQFTVPQIREWWSSVFHPGVMQFTIVGNLAVEKVIGLAARYLGNLPGGEVLKPPELLTRCAFPTGYTRREVYRGMENRTIVKIYMPGPRWNAEEYPALATAMKILDMRIMIRIREALGGTYYSYIYSTSDDRVEGRDYIVIGFATDPDRIQELIKAADEEVAKFIAEGPSGDEIASAREVFQKDWEEKQKQDGFWAGVMNGAEYRPQPLTWALDLHDKMMKSDAAQMKSAVAKWLTPPVNRAEFVALKERKPPAEAEAEK